MNKVEILFKDKGINIGTDLHPIYVYTKKNALQFIEECRKESINILGIDGFYIGKDYIRPSMENSIDYSTESSQKLNLDVHLESVKFLNAQSNELFFEIVCDD